MRRTYVLGMIVVAGVVAAAAANLGAQQQPAAGGQAGRGGGGPALGKIEKVADNLYFIFGAGGNTGVYIAEKGVVLVDTKNPNNGQGILDQVKSVTDKPITHIINTHTHGDHNGSNVFFPASVEIVSQENTAANMQKMPAFQEALNRHGLPDRTYKDKMTLLSGKDAIDLYLLWPGAHQRRHVCRVPQRAASSTPVMRLPTRVSRSSIATTAAAASRIPRRSRKPRRASGTSTPSSTGIRR